MVMVVVMVVVVEVAAGSSSNRSGRLSGACSMHPEQLLSYVRARCQLGLACSV